jgi:hypothetical protein
LTSATGNGFCILRSSTLCDALRCGRIYLVSHSRPGASHSIRTSLRYFSGHAFLNDVTDEESFHGWLAAAGFDVSDPLAIVVQDCRGRHGGHRRRP